MQSREALNPVAKEDRAVLNWPALRRVLYFVLPLCVAMAVLAASNPRGDFWGGVEPPKAQCEAYDPGRLHGLSKLTKEVYDQAKLDRLIREPQNTASNLAYAAVGLAVVFAARRPLVRSFGWGCVFLGAGSGLYHASLLSQWRMLDILGVYVVLVTLVAIGTLAVFKISFSQRGEAALALLLWIAACAAGVWRNDVRFWGIKWLDSTYVVVALVAAGSILALAAGRIAREKTRYRWSLAALLVAAPLAFTGGLGDRFGGFWADPEGLVQGHSVWHGFGAVALLAACEVFFTTNWARSVIWQDGKSQ